MRTGSMRFMWSVAVLLAAGFAFVGGSAHANQDNAVRAVVVDGTLQERLDANPSGGVTAIVTTWNRDGLDAVEAAGVTGPRLRVLPMIVTAGLTSAQLEKLHSMPQVRSVWGERKWRTTMEDTTWITKARYVWATNNGSGGLQGFGVTGRGIELAVIDTGIDGKHEDTDNLVEFCESNAGNVPADPFLGVHCTPWNLTFNAAPAGLCGAPPSSSNQGPPGPCRNKARGDALDDEGHGSHVSGTVAGTGHASGGTQNTHSTIGISPHADLRVYSSNIGISLLNWQTLAAYDDLIAKREAGYNRVVAVNNSWGGGDGADYEAGDPTHVAIKRAWDAGILSVFAASNSGPEHNTLSAQCVDPYAACIAASTKPDQKVMFSSVGRPSQPMDTNRDGVADAADVQPDNHDWRLGQALQLGRYRPTITAPGVNIYSISANSAGCREDDLLIPIDEQSGCYEPLNGTSMATPHVTGAVGLIAQAFRSTHGRLPRPNETLDILERSANTSKLPAWEAEEQGTGRLDVHEAVKFARSYPQGLARPNLGHATPPYEQNAYPNGSASRPPAEQETGCTGPVSWTSGNTNEIFDPVGQPPVAPLPSYGQHFINVPEKAERLQVTVRWPGHPTANLYVRLWRPGVDPDAETQPAGRTRVFPDQEALGLLDVPLTSRHLDVRSPEESNTAEGTPGLPATLPQGQWVMRVYHRIGDRPTTCGATQEQPKQTVGYRYTVETVITRVTHRPTVTIDQPAANAQTTGRWVDIRGRAGYPPPDAPAPGTTGYSWEGVTNWEVPDSATSGSPHDEPDPNNPRPVLYFHGNPHAPSDPDEQGCIGDGATDNTDLVCRGPKLLVSNELFAGAAASWKGNPSQWLLNGTSPGGDRLPIDPNWVWCLAVDGLHCVTTDPDAPTPPVSIGGPMTVEWWASCGPLCIFGGPEWTIRLWIDGNLVVEEDVGPGPELPNAPERLRATINVPPTTANQRVTLHVEPIFLIDQYLPFFIYYDSQNPCVPNVSTGPCDSLVRMPVGSTGGSAGGAAVPQNVRVTDLPADAPYPSARQLPALRVAWDPVEGATSYDVYRSTNPLNVGTRVFRGAGTTCMSPEAPASEPDDIWTGHDRSGQCFTDTGVQLRTTYYYRVFATAPAGRSGSSEIAYGTPTRYDREVKVKLDRLYGPQYWEYALLSPSPNPTLDISGTQWRHLWDTLELAAGPHNLFARSFTQGIGSTKATRTLRDDGGGGGGGGGGPGCPDDDDGDGDDDEEDGDSDDDGDDRDDDCEDDDDHEEDEDD